MSDTAPIPTCNLNEIESLFATRVRPHVASCADCHDGTADPGEQLSPGPPWYHPTDDRYIVGDILGGANMHPASAAESTFLLKPLAEADGGVEHTGGDRFGRESDQYEDILAWLQVAIPCAPEWVSDRGDRSRP